MKDELSANVGKYLGNTLKSKCLIINTNSINKAFCTNSINELDVCLSDIFQMTEVLT